MKSGKAKGRKQRLGHAGAGAQQVQSGRSGGL